LYILFRIRYIVKKIKTNSPPPLSSPLKGEEMDDGYSILKGEEMRRYNSALKGKQLNINNPSLKRDEIR